MRNGINLTFAARYGYNPYVGSVDSTGKVSKLWNKECIPVKSSRIKAASHKILSGDALKYNGTELRFIRYHNTIWEEMNINNSGRVWYGHSRAANFVFADGHSGAIQYSDAGPKFSSSSTQKTSTQYWLWPEYDGPKQ